MPDQVSINRLNQLHPAIRMDAMKAYNEAVRRTPVGVHPFIVQTLRSFEESDALYQKGRTRPGPIITNAKAGQSYHNYGLALDFALQINNILKWKVDKNWMIVVECFKEQGFDWGGDWRTFKDQPHLEKRFGLHWKELLKRYKAGQVDENGYVII